MTDSLLSSNDHGPLIEVASLGKSFQLYDRPRDRLLQLFASGDKKHYREFWALRDISFQVKRGEAVGIIGRNGAGKSTLLQMVTGTLSPTTGTVSIRGRIAALLQLGSGFNPDFSGRENVYLNGAILGFSREEVSRNFESIADFADIGEFIDQPVKNYSSGMTMRLAFAVSTCLNPDILIVDEALAVGDALFQRKCYARLDEFVANGGTLLFVSHSLETVKRVCDRAIYLKEGNVRAIGTPSEVAAIYEFDLDARKNFDGAEAAESNARDYGNKSAEIVELWIENHDGQVVTAISESDPFKWCFRVKFQQTFDNVLFGMKIVNTEGLIVYATNSEMLGESVGISKSGQTRVIKFEVANNALSPGEYFLSAGVSQGSKTGGHFMHRKVDAAHLKIEHGINIRHSGMVNLGAQMVVA